MEEALAQVWDRWWDFMMLIILVVFLPPEWLARGLTFLDPGAQLPLRGAVERIAPHDSGNGDRDEGG